MRYLLSKLIPVRMRSTYGTAAGRERATWWQFRGHVYRHRVAAA